MHRPWSVLEFFLNGTELSVNSENSRNMRNHWRMKRALFKDLFCYLCLLGTEVASWFLTQVILGLNTHFLQKLSTKSADSVDSLEFILVKLRCCTDVREFQRFQRKIHLSCKIHRCLKAFVLSWKFVQVAWGSINALIHIKLCNPCNSSSGLCWVQVKRLWQQNCFPFN